MNGYYNYPNIELWNEDCWKERYSRINPLAARVSACAYVEDYHGCYSDCKSSVFFHSEWFKVKTASLETPEFKEECRCKGFDFESHEMGKNRWLTMVPHKVLKNRNSKYPVLIIEDLQKKMDPNWAMRVIDSRQEYLSLALEQSFILVYIVRDTPDFNGAYADVLGEAMTLYPGDGKQVYLDITPIRKRNISLSEIQGFSLKDPEGNILASPDQEIKSFYPHDICALNISGQYINRISSRWFMLCKSVFNVGKYDFDKLKYSKTGKRVAAGMYLEKRFSSCNDPQWKEYWKEQGLLYEEHRTKGERWISLVPRDMQAREEKLPILAIMAEVNDFNDWLPVSTCSSYFEYCDLAAGGEFILLFFALETPEDNELWCDIIDSAASLYAADLSRVYMLGQSHNGHLAREFARCHPEKVAAVATLSNSHGLPCPVDSHEAVLVTDESIEAFRRVKIPFINLKGKNEGKGMSDSPAQLADAWQRRLKAFCCKVRSAEEIYYAAQFGSYVERSLGFPVDQSYIAYVDGIECCIGYIKNEEGKYHLCVVEMDNTPHYPAPAMAEIAWSFLRRFSRNLITGEVADVMDLCNHENKIQQREGQEEIV